MTTQIGFGGSCHWCTEAIFSSLKGVGAVQQGWIASDEAERTSFSEAVIVDFDPAVIPLNILVSIHLATHSSTSSHSMREKYRSAIYTFSEEQKLQVRATILALQDSYPEKIITEVLSYKAFRLNKQGYLNYYYNDPEKPFCRSSIDPKLRQLMKDFSGQIATDRLKHLSF